MIYLDSSAIVKLARQEAETPALRSWLAANPSPIFSSSLARTECARALFRTQPTAMPVLSQVLATMHQKPITDEILDAAARFPDPSLRSLDAVHLATADEFRQVLAHFVAYDKRLIESAGQLGLPVVTPV